MTGGVTVAHRFHFCLAIYCVSPVVLPSPSSRGTCRRSRSLWFQVIHSCCYPCPIYRSPQFLADQGGRLTGGFLFGGIILEANLPDPWFWFWSPRCSNRLNVSAARAGCQTSVALAVTTTCFNLFSIPGSSWPLPPPKTSSTLLLFLLYIHF